MEGRKERREREGRQEGKLRRRRRTHYEYETYSIIYSLNLESHKRLWDTSIEQQISHKKNAPSQCWGRLGCTIKKFQSISSISITKCA